MNYLEQIKAEVVKVCPEIMELKAGCKVVWIDKEWTCADCSIKGCWMLTRKDIRSVIVEPEKIQEILGSPIELHHILRTMQEKGIPLIDKDTWGVDVGSYEVTKLISSYNLALPAALQSEETLKGIAELLSDNNK